jgi:hypothetical protein
MVHFDHLIVVAADIDEAGEALFRGLGLASTPGGRHQGLGTGNRIVPLGPDYIEIMGVVDPAEAAQSELGRWVAARADTGGGLGALCLRTENADEVADRLGLDPLPMSRERTDGTILSWKLVGLAETLADPSLPFFIEWAGPPEQHPGRNPADHRGDPTGISWVHLSGDRQRIERWIGPHRLDIRISDGAPGIVAAGISTKNGEIRLNTE